MKLAFILASVLFVSASVHAQPQQSVQHIVGNQISAKRTMRRT